MPTEDFDIVIIGGGPAGLSAGIYAARADLDTLILDKPDRLLEKVESIENYFGFPDGVSGAELLELGRKQARKFGAEIVEEEALITRKKDEIYVVETADEEYWGKGLILAPGIEHRKPPIDGLEELEGRGVSYCVTCDAPLFEGKKVGLLGSRDYAAKEALELHEFTEDVTIFTNGKDLKIKDELRKEISERGIPVVNEKVEKLKGEENFQGLELENREVNLDGLFVAVGTSRSVNFAKSLGIPVEGDKIMVNEDLSTGLPRLYAAGDCTGETRQISVAVGEGAKAALKLIEELRETEYTDWQKTG